MVDPSASNHEHQQGEHATVEAPRPKRKIICADFTALIAADSYLNEVGLQDPAARDVVEALADSLTNDLDICYFQRAAPAVALLRSIGRTWTDRVIKIGPVEPFAFKRERQIPITRPILHAFDSNFRGSHRQRALEWLRCECTDDYRAQLFWIGNTEDDLRRAHEALDLDAPRALLRNDIRNAIGNADVINVANRACEAVGPITRKLRHQWDAGDYCVAYLLWSYVKGYEYAARLDERYAYLTHFIRETAWAPGSAARVTISNKEDLFAFPWGTVLTAACTRDELGQDNGFADLTHALGHYHLKRHGQLQRELDDLGPKTKTGDLTDRGKAYKRAYRAVAEHAAARIQHAHPRHRFNLDQFWNGADLVATLAPLAAKFVAGADFDASLAVTLLKWEYRPQIDLVLSSTIQALATRTLAAEFQQRHRAAFAAYLASYGVIPPPAP